jgi:hypothetical protein
VSTIFFTEPSNAAVAFPFIWLSANPITTETAAKVIPAISGARPGEPTRDLGTKPSANPRNARFAM